MRAPAAAAPFESTSTVCSKCGDVRGISQLVIFSSIRNWLHNSDVDLAYKTCRMIYARNEFLASMLNCVGNFGITYKVSLLSDNGTWGMYNGFVLLYLCVDFTNLCACG